ncbi:flagellar hook-associated protein 2 [Modicisalibacter ilicicola DSM 19980]|uniref:Flagellar hook-associated protein 2 n=1 Tax=Modicisalibacter ilicicola DSM 19980 TaxID=1121942 RepID=A0A1M5CND0_9GAMM|nr:flagellar filament capping protein FliD [Halomonas ilicicola]SHF56219.1 flagellar hook-associated protein 2 [Halomonas ilicicola DSM 19980]
MASISSLGIGSGMDLNGLVDQLESAERQQLAPIVQQQRSYQAKISAFGKLESALDKFQEAAAKLNDADTFHAVKSSMSGDSMTAAAGSSAVPGSYRIKVEQLAQAHSLATTGMQEKTDKLGGGSLSIQVGDENLAIDITEDESSLESIRDAINAQEGGVTASIINDGSDKPYRLVLTSKDTGIDSQMTVTASGDARLQDLLTHNAQDSTMVQTTEAKNAALSINGISISSQSNRVEEAIQGVTLNLEKTTGNEEETFTVSQDSAAIAKNVRGFVDAYNALQETMGSLTSYNKETNTAGQLLGDSTMRGVESRLRNLMGTPLGGEGLQRLADVGIELKLDGSLEVDSEKLDTIIADSPESLSRFFGGDDATEGLADMIETSVTAMLNEGGLLSNATSGLENRIDSLSDRYDRMESSIDATVARYRKQFAQMDTLVAQMNSTMSYLGQQFDAMNAQLGRE